LREKEKKKKRKKEKKAKERKGKERDKKKGGTERRTKKGKGRTGRNALLKIYRAVAECAQTRSKGSETVIAFVAAHACVHARGATRHSR